MSCKPPGYWDDWNNVEAALRPVIARLGRFPTTSEVRALPRGGSITTAILRAGGFNVVAKAMGLEAAHLPSGHWQKWENVEQALRTLIETLGHFPSRRELNRLGESALAKAIVDYHGGPTDVSKRMGVAPRQQPNGYWKSWENVKRILDELTKTFGRFPSHGELTARRYRPLTSAIVRYHGGLDHVRRRMGHELLSSKLLDRYADRIAEVFMRDPDDAVSFEDFLTGLERDCRYERDLRIRLGLPPETETN